jgi:hypothetical protein
MNKFLHLCEKVESYLKEQDMAQPDQLPADSTTAPGQPVEQQPVLDPNTQSEVRDVSNEKVQELIGSIVDFYQKGRALSADSLEHITKLPSTINAENSESTVDELIQIFSSSNFPKDSSSTLE